MNTFHAGADARKPLQFAAAVALVGLMSCEPAEAASNVCGEHDQILKRLNQAYNEAPTALGLTTDGGVLEVLVSPEGGWTILVTYPKRPTCILAVGKGWQTLQLAGQPA